jgi:hypothetical protein
VVGGAPRQRDVRQMLIVPQQGEAERDVGVPEVDRRVAALPGFVRAHGERDVVRRVVQVRRVEQHFGGDAHCDRHGGEQDATPPRAAFAPLGRCRCRLNHARQRSTQGGALPRPQLPRLARRAALW